MADIGAGRFARDRRIDPVTAASMVLAVDAVLLLTVAVVGVPFLLFFFADETGSWATLWPLVTVWMAALVFGGVAAASIALFLRRGSDRSRRSAAAAALGTALAAGVLIATSIQTAYAVLALPGALFIAANLLAARVLSARPGPEQTEFARHVPANLDPALTEAGLDDLDLDLADLELTPDELARLEQLDREAAERSAPHKPSLDVTQRDTSELNGAVIDEPASDQPATKPAPASVQPAPGPPEDARVDVDEIELDRVALAPFAEPAPDRDTDPDDDSEELLDEDLRSRASSTRRRSRGPAALHTLSGVQLSRRARRAKSAR